MSDPFSRHMSGLESPASDGFAITPSDSVDLPIVVRAIYVGGGGNIALVMKSGASIVLHNVVPGCVLPLRAVRVAATGTTATNLVGLV